MDYSPVLRKPDVMLADFFDALPEYEEAIGVIGGHNKGACR